MADVRPGSQSGSILEDDRPGSADPATADHRRPGTGLVGDLLGQGRVGRAEVEERHDGVPQLGLVGDLPTLAVRLALLSLSGTLRRCGLGGSPGGLDCRSWGPDPDQPAMGAGPCSGFHASQ